MVCDCFADKTYDGPSNTRLSSNATMIPFECSRLCQSDTHTRPINAIGPPWSRYSCISPDPSSSLQHRSSCGVRGLRDSIPPAAVAVMIGEEQKNGGEFQCECSCSGETTLPPCEKCCGSGSHLADEGAV